MAKNYPKLSGTLKKLLFDNNMKASDLAREVNLPTPTVHRLVTGKSTRPYQSSLKPIAEFFAMDVEELLEATPETLTSGNTPALNAIQHIPYYDWLHLANHKHADTLDTPKLPFIGKISKEGFATTLQDSSMEPIFPKGSTLIFEPNHVPADRCYVLVKFAESTTFLFRQLLIDGDQRYLKPLNPDLTQFSMRVLSNNDKIIAVLLESRNQYL